MRAAPAMLSMLPKFELVPIRMYFSVLPKVRRPSRTPWAMADRLACRRITSAAARATSVALSTLMPTSATCRDGASLMPSPR